MNELYLAYFWKNRLFDQLSLVTSDGQPLTVLSTGTENFHSGADFQNAKIRIDGIEWVGSVELHVKASDWYLHHHDTDLAYENVILHVIWENDLAVSYQDGTSIPTLILSNYLTHISLADFATKLNVDSTILCASFFEQIPIETKYRMLEKCLKDRLNEKADLIYALLKNADFDWEETFFQSLAKSFGFRVNAEPMLRLAQSISLKVILRYRDRPYAVESILFGLAGFLEEPLHDDYQKELRKEFIHLQKKHQWENSYLNLSDWKFLRLRPYNFPTIRIAQFSEMIKSNCSLISLLLEIKELKTIKTLFDIPLDFYWDKHYHFGRESTKNYSTLGLFSFQSICINTLIPMLICYAKVKQQYEYGEKALRWLNELRVEENSVVNIYKQLHLPIRSAADSQACIHLNRYYCTQKKCLSCGIGTEIINHPLNQPPPH
jgi:hypothetical protein